MGYANRWAVYSPSDNVVIDIVPPGFAVEAARARYGPEYGEDLVVLPLDEAARLYEDGFKSPPREISAEDWWYAFEVLPHASYFGHRGGGESFHSPELVAGNIANIYVRIGKRYFHFTDSRFLRPEERVAKVRAAFPDVGPHDLDSLWRR